MPLVLQLEVAAPLPLSCAFSSANVKAFFLESLDPTPKNLIRKSYGFKTSDMLKISLYHKLGKLPVPELAHEYF
jgi:transposase